MLHNREQRAAAEVGRALEQHGSYRFACQAIAQGLADARLADAGLARQQHDLAFAVAGERPALQQQRDLAVAADKLDQTLHVLGLEARRGGALAEHAPRLLRRGEAFELEPPQRFERERLAEQLARVVGKHDFTRLGLRLQPRGEIRRLAAGRTLSRRRADADLADDDPASGDADAGLKFGVAVEALRLERLNDAQCRARGARRIVLVRLRIAEVNQHAVAEELRDVARVGCHCCRHRVVIAADELSQVLGVEPARQCCGADQVAEHHGQLPAFGS